MKNLLVVLVHVSSIPTSLEGSNLLLNILLALLIGESVNLILEPFCLPVLILVGGLELRVFTDGSVRVGVDFLNVLGTNAIS